MSNPKQHQTQKQRSNQASEKSQKLNQTRNEYQKPSQSGSQKASSDEKSKRGPSLKFIRNWCFVILLLSFLLEYLSTSFGAAFIIIPLAGSVFSFLVSIITTLLKKDNSKSDKKPRTKDGFEARLQLGIHNIIYRIFDDVIALVVFCAAVSLLISSGLAYFHTVGHISQAIVEAFYVIMPNENDPMPLPNTNEDPVETEKKEPTNSTSPVNLIPPAMTPYLTILNPDLEKSLEDEERNLLFFLSDDYLIDDWTNQDMIVEKVRQKINDERNEQKDNKFDNYAPAPTQSEVARVSELESTLASSAELDEIIGVREATYKEYPMYRLAKLLSENYSRYGLAYDYLDSNICTAEYYYAYAISWYNEALTYEKTGEPVDELLRMIAIRYHDLAAVLPGNSPYQQYASKLSDAYYTVVNSGEYADSVFP